VIGFLSRNFEQDVAAFQADKTQKLH
jgi:hypothetical protein